MRPLILCFTYKVTWVVKIITWRRYSVTAQRHSSSQFFKVAFDLRLTLCTIATDVNHRLFTSPSELLRLLYFKEIQLFGNIFSSDSHERLSFDFYWYKNLPPFLRTKIGDVGKFCLSSFSIKSWLKLLRT